MSIRGHLLGVTPTGALPHSPHLSPFREPAGAVRRPTWGQVNTIAVAHRPTSLPRPVGAERRGSGVLDEGDSQGCLSLDGSARVWFKRSAQRWWLPFHTSWANNGRAGRNGDFHQPRADYNSKLYHVHIKTYSYRTFFMIRWTCLMLPSKNYVSLQGILRSPTQNFSNTLACISSVSPLGPMLKRRIWRARILISVCYIKVGELPCRTGS